jgi:predicted pyridoxine 5'-phosphate oxidase superfamily flavin-nucleotide-binding protein
LRIALEGEERANVAKLTQQMKDMVSVQQCWHATVSKTGVPNIAPKRSTRVLDDETLIFNEGTGGTTWQNILDGSRVAAGVVDREILDGFRFLGTPEVQTEGPLYDEAAEVSARNGLARPKAVVLIHIEEMHSLKPGPGAGRRII